MSPVPAQMWSGVSPVNPGADVAGQRLCNPGADVAGQRLCSPGADVVRYEPSPGADAAGQRLSIPAQMWRVRASQSRRGCGMSGPVNPGADVALPRSVSAQMRRGRTQCPRRRCGGVEPQSRTRCCAHAAGRCAVPLHLPHGCARSRSRCRSVGGVRLPASCCRGIAPVGYSQRTHRVLTGYSQGTHSRPVAAEAEPPAQCRCGGVEPQSHCTLGCAARGRAKSRCKQRHGAC